MIHWHVYLSGQVPDSSTPRGNIAGQSAAKDSYILAGDVVNIVMKRRADDCSEVSVAFFNGAERAHQFVVGFKGHATESDGLWVASFVAIGDGKAAGARLAARVGGWLAPRGGAGLQNRGSSASGALATNACEVKTYLC